MTGITLKDEEFKFLSSYLHESDRAKLEARAEKVLEDSGSLQEYKTINSLNWLCPQVNKQRAYREMKSRFDDPYPPHVVELGCCFGTDVRQLILDGLPSENILATDIVPEYWDLGLDLYQDQSKQSTKTVFCDSTASGPLDSHREKYDYAYALLVLHVFPKTKSLDFIKRAFDLLAPGGSFFGTTVGRKSGDGPWNVRKDADRWIYCQQGLEAVLKSVGFGEVSVELATYGERMLERTVNESGREEDLCQWSFTAKKVEPEWASC